tara:strand:+ start:168 stop:1076 length:909 start_codon:yes stop_codon:yes gene_type:complete
MNNWMTATLVALTLVMSNRAIAEPSPDLGGLEAKLFGEINQAITTNQSGDSDFVTGVNSSHFGVDLTDSRFGENKWFGRISADVDLNDKDDGIDTKDAYVGYQNGPLELTFGRQMNMRGKIREATVGIFEGPNKFKTQNEGREGQTLKAQYEMGTTVFVGTVTTDIGASNTKVDSWEVGTSYLFRDNINMVSGFARDEDTSTNTLLGGVNYTWGDYLFGGTYERALKHALKPGKGKFNLVAQKRLDDKNTIKGGYQTIESGTDTYLLEAVHEFNGYGAVYANAEHITDDSAENYTLGFRLRF